MSSKDLESMRNEDRIKRLEIELNKLKKKQQNDIDDVEDAIDEDNRLRDSRTDKISDDVYLIESFIREKLAPGELEQFIRHVNNNRGFPPVSPASSVASDDSFTGGRRKKKTRKKKRRKSKKKTKRKY